MYLEYGVREKTPWDRVGVIVARYALRSDALNFIKQERKLQNDWGCSHEEQLAYFLVRFRKVKK